MDLKIYYQEKLNISLNKVERTKKSILRISLLRVFIFIGGFIALCFGASVWLYSVLMDSTSMIIMAVLFIALIWYALNVRSTFKKDE